jgi:hypothetical protein
MQAHPPTHPTTHAVQPDLAADPAALLAVFLGPPQAPVAAVNDSGPAGSPPLPPPHTPQAAARVIHRSGQRHLQAMFGEVYATPTFSNNNAWLRRKLLEGK